MNYVFEYLEKMGYEIPTEYYSYVNDWIQIWKGKSDWLDVKTINGTPYPMYSLGMAKRSCEDLASIITSEPFNITAKADDKLLKEDLERTRVLKKLPNAIEIMAYSGTVGTIARITNADIIGKGDNAYLSKNINTKIKTIDVKGNQIIPLRIDDGEIIDCAFVSIIRKKINNVVEDITYLETHELKPRGYQITNIFFDKDGKNIKIDGILDTYNTLSNTPIFSLCKLEKSNTIDNNYGLGMALFGDSIDQLKMLDLTYNNFGMDFKLGQKVMVVNKKLTRVETEEYTDEDGKVKTRQKVVYPTDLQKQLFTEVTDGIMGDGTTQNPYIFEYNPDLRVGDNKDGVQFALNNYSFKIGYGTHYYSFENGNLTTATEAVLSRQDFVLNGTKNRKAVSEYLIGVCRAILVCEKMLGNNIDENQEIEIAEVDGFLQDDETKRTKMLQDEQAGLISKKRYLMKVYNMTEEEANLELAEIEKSNPSLSSILGTGSEQ